MGLDTLLKNTYNEQLKLVRKSLQDTSPADDAQTEQPNSRINSSPKDSAIKKENPIRISCGIQYTHRSRKFRFTQGESATKTSSDTSITDVATSPAEHSTASTTNMSVTSGDSSIIVDDTMLGSSVGDSKEFDKPNGMKESQATASVPNDPIKCSILPPSNMVLANFPKIEGENEAQASMLMSWYMAGYHTGYYEAMKQFKKDQKQ